MWVSACAGLMMAPREHKPGCTRLSAVEAVREGGGHFAVVQAARGLPVQGVWAVSCCRHISLGAVWSLGFRLGVLPPSPSPPHPNRRCTHLLSADPWSQPWELLPACLNSGKFACVIGPAAQPASHIAEGLPWAAVRGTVESGWGWIHSYALAGV